MASIPVPFKITYGPQSVGGNSAVYRLDGAHRESITFEELNLEFIVQVVGDSRTDFQNRCATLEEAFRERDQDLVIDLDNIADPDGASTFTYLFGTDILNTRSNIQKTGDDDTDAGLSRAYAVSITGQLPSTDKNSSLLTGLRDISFSLTYESGRQKRITFTGVYTATPAQLTPVRAAKQARQNFKDGTTGADAEAAAYFALVAAGDAMELVSEDFNEDRNNHTVQFKRTYIELLDDQTQGVRDAPEIRDHNFSMSESLDQPGDSGKNVFRLREVSAKYDCAIDIEVTTDPMAVFLDKIRPHLVARFKSEFSPQQFCVTRRLVDYDHTRKRLSVDMTFFYQKAGGENLTEISSSVRITELQNVDWTPTHENNRFAANIDIGWATRQRITTINSMVIGEETPKPRIESAGGGTTTADATSGGGKGGSRTANSTGGGAAVLPAVPGGGAGFGLPDPGGGGGWIEISIDREATTHWLGDPDEQQLLVTKLAEQKTEQYFEKPKGRVKVKFR